MALYHSSLFLFKAYNLRTSLKIIYHILIIVGGKTVKVFLSARQIYFRSIAAEMNQTVVRLNVTLATRSRRNRD